MTVAIDMGDFQQLRSQRLAENFDRAVQGAEHIAIRWYLRSKFHMMAGRYAEALRDMREALAREKDRPLFCHGLARFYVVAPEAFRDAPAAVVLAEKAVDLREGN